MGHKKTQFFAFGLAAALAFGAGGLRTEASSGTTLPKAGIAAVFDFSGSSASDTSSNTSSDTSAEGTSAAAKTIEDRISATSKISGSSLYRTISKSAAASIGIKLGSEESISETKTASVVSAAVDALSLLRGNAAAYVAAASASSVSSASSDSDASSGGSASEGKTAAASDTGLTLIEQVPEEPIPETASITADTEVSSDGAAADSTEADSTAESTASEDAGDESTDSADTASSESASGGTSIGETLTAVANSAKTSAQETAEESDPSSDSAQSEDGFGEGSSESAADLAVATVSDYVNVRAEASTDSEIVGKLYKDGVATVLDDNGDGWVKIQSGSVTGYISKDFLATGSEAEKLADENKSQVAEVTTETLRVRAAADINSDVITLVPQGEKLNVIEETDGWLKVSTDEGEGYISADYADVEAVYQVAESIEEEQQRLAEEAAEAEAKAEADTYNRRVEAVNYAMQFLGNPYVWGGTSLTNGIDCSGFTMQVYAHFGYSLPHYDVSQRSCGTAVDSLADALPGDLVFYSGHVAIYCGGGQVVHASNPRDGIKVSNANYRSIVCIRRIIQN
ncbi:MAG: SH3 domain-containing protein [Lachnospiraceae bacterium]|nr:SH3 domain-containing protein [Lachnospiraceae bacterium]MCH4029516.1 SH3 domain-containing protein [Lachnospiraceae bacterium]MCH4067634.1 SH3 domain-containing protein [Lachnospiraceae bacterium]MCH4113657.1 SH3 domain-containing protein [Lachnospiraceae bacterium]MCI1353756.1 SH3 domain-containing protein [Lachnospiraceae bacterium]